MFVSLLYVCAMVRPVSAQDMPKSTLPFELHDWQTTTSPAIKLVDQISAEPLLQIAENPTIQPVLPVGQPNRLLIPEIGVNAHVEHRGLTPQGAVDVPDVSYTVSWYDLGPKPGALGSAVIVGHYGIWKNGIHSVFDRLPELNIGNHIFVQDEYGTVRSFRVIAMKIYGKDQQVPEIFNRTDGVYLNIITCHGTWLPAQKTYSQRLVIFTQLD